MGTLESEIVAAMQQERWKTARHLLVSSVIGNTGDQNVGARVMLRRRKKLNRLIGVPRRNRSGENLGKFIDSLNGWLGDYALLSRNWNVKSLSVAVASEHRPKPEEITCPRYHFVVRALDHTHDDPDGMHLPNHEAARDQGHRIVRELTEEGCRPGDAALVIQDETGQIVHSITF